MSDLRKKLLAAKVASFEKTGRATSLAGASDDLKQAQLVAEAEQWWGAALWNWFGLLGIGKEERQVRLRMISALKESIDIIKEVEDLLEGSQENSEKISQATAKFLEFSSFYLGNFLEDLSELMSLASKREYQRHQLPVPEEEPKLPEVPEPSGEEQGSEEMIPQKLFNYLNLNLEQKLSRIISSEIDSNQKERFRVWFNQLQKDLREGNMSIPQLQEEIQSLEQEMDQVIEELNRQASWLINDDIYKVAQNVVTRWIRRKLMGVNPNMIEQIYLKIIQDLVEMKPLLKSMIKRLKSRDPNNVWDMHSESNEVLKKIKGIQSRISLLADHMYSIQEKSPLKSKTLRKLRGVGREIEDIFNPKKE